MGRFLELGSDRVWVDDPGGSGSSVVLVHPGWGDARIWDGVVARLPPQTRSIRYDNRGYGHSPVPTEPFTWHQDLVAVMDRLDVTHATIVGHSGGGATAVGLALSHPERVGSLVLIAPGIADYPWPEHDDYFTQFDALFTAGDREGLVNLGLRTWASADPGPDAQTQIRGAVSAMFNCSEHLMPEPPAFDLLHTIATRCHILIGDLDHHSVIDCGHAVAARLPHCDLTAVPHADHLLPLHHPDLVAGAIAAVTELQ